MTDPLDAQLRDALNEEATKVAPDPAAWSRITARLEPRRQRRRVQFLVAACAAVALGLVATAVGMRPDPGEDRVSATAGTEGGEGEGDGREVDGTTDRRPPADTGPTPLQFLAQPPPPPPSPVPPAQLVAVTVDGRLVVVEVGTGKELRTLATSGDPRQAPPREGPGPNVIDHVALSPDGRTAWFSECCEPAGGSLFRVAVDGSAAPERVADGYTPSVSTDSRYVAAVNAFGVLIFDPSANSSLGWMNERWQGEYQQLAWSLDARRLVVRVGMPEAGQLLALDPSTFGPAAGLTTARSAEPVVLEGSSWSLPTFRRDGRLVVAEREARTWRGRVFDLDAGHAVDAESFDYGGTPLSQDYDPTGEWFLTVVRSGAGGSGRATVIGPDGERSEVPGRYRLASW